MKIPVQEGTIKVTFKELTAKQFYEGKVIRNNKTSGKITAPNKWIDKEVIVILKQEHKNEY